MEKLDTLETMMEGGWSKDKALRFLLKRDISMAIAAKKNEEFYSQYSATWDRMVVTHMGRRYVMTIELINENATKENKKDDMRKISSYEEYILGRKM